ncbi:MAG TPA: CMP-N-acetylneuraminic acid synthetase [Brevundimonas sp.]|nr:CMP-N-acetylneuraminic acid synthetase [Brevundimonas sp.]
MIASTISTSRQPADKRPTMNVCALMIGRGGSSLKNKNVLPVLGVPLLLWGCSAARRSRYVNHYYISSDDPDILATAALAGFQPIRRPDYLASDTARSTDAVRHALDLVEANVGTMDIVVVMHANVGTVTAELIDRCIDILVKNPSASSVIPSHENAEYHPMRAKRVLEDGSLSSFFDGPISPNRQELPTAVFFDHSFWVLRGRSVIFDPEGQEPWPCMGRRILPFVTQGCLDVHTLEDIDRTAAWITANKVSPPEFDLRKLADEGI